METQQLPQVSGLRVGQTVRMTLACSRKSNLLAKTGTRYLALELRDRSGTIPARAFRDVDALDTQFEQGDLVLINGKVVRYRDELQLELQSIASVESSEEELANFLPVTYRDLNELDGFLEHLAREVHDRDFRLLLDELLADENLRKEWRLSPCTRNGHHAYIGGLLEHTVAVTMLAAELCQLHPRLNSDLLLCAAIVHDLGKTQEFQYGADFTLSVPGRMLGHIELGMRILNARWTALPEDKQTALAHCVLCHHGAEAAPNRRFALPEAIALYRLNTLDATVKGVLEHGLSP